MTELREKLQQSLGSTYTIERELGGGGMSRVLVARDTTLQRDVVVKVLPPELVAGVNVERFRREILLAAGLQHPHIVPVLAAGETDGLPWFTMPFVDGESLRQRLARGPVSISETIGILRDVSKALAYAHDRGVVHRDIKPDNVLLSGGSAVVTDFGIAKALSAARGPGDGLPTRGATLTQIGTSIGTPTYMAPEQAAGDPSTDARADIYAFGCMAYELLSGRPPFIARTPQKLLAAHMSETPQPVLELRPDTPAALADLVMRCLAKDADARPQAAADIVRVLETVTSGAGHAALAPILLGGRGMLRKALAIYAGAFVVVAIVAKAAIVGIGLPDWVFPGALVIMVLGLPVILFTGYVHHTTRRALTATPTFTPGGTPSLMQGTMVTIALKASPHMSWRRTAIGGAWAVGAFVSLIGVYMLLRAFGIGPAGSLIAKGAIDANEKILVVDFPSPRGGDTTLGPVVTDAFRTALAQSQSINVMQQAGLRDALRRLERPTNTRIDFPLARQIATRDGIKAVIDADLIGVGGKYVIALRLVSAASGEELANFRETANSQADLLPVVDKLAKDVRAKIGESLRKVQATPPLEQVTTPSLDALKKYVEGSRAIAADGDFARGAALLQEAIALDTGFAMAYRRLGIEYNNRGLSDKAGELLEHAYANRDRLSDAERYLLIGSYFQSGTHQDAAKAQSALEQLVEQQPTNTAALNNLGNLYRLQHNFAKAESLYERAVEVGPPAAVFYENLVRARARQGKMAEARLAVDALSKALPTNVAGSGMRAQFYFAARQYDSSAAVVDSVLRTNLDADSRANFMSFKASLSALRGKVVDARRLQHEAWADWTVSGVSYAPVMDAAIDAMYAVWFLGDSSGAVRTMQDSLARHPLSGPAGTVTDSYYYASWVYALAGKVDQARDVIARWEQSRKSHSETDDSTRGIAMRANVELAAGKYADAARDYVASTSLGCDICVLPLAAQAYDLAGKPDSAIAFFERFAASGSVDVFDVYAQSLPGAYKRLGELYEAKGDRQRAISNYMKFITLWKDADPQLQPKVAEVKARVARLSRVEGR